MLGCGPQRLGGARVRQSRGLEQTLAVLLAQPVLQHLAGGAERDRVEGIVYRTSRRIPDAEEIRPWFEAVTRLWDDATEYQRIADAARKTARQLYDETALRQRHAAFFTAPPPYPELFE